MSRNFFVSCFFAISLAQAALLPATAQEPPAAVDGFIPRDESSLSRIEAALDERISVDFEETELGDVALYLEDLLNIQIELDHQALHEIRLYADTPITFAVTDISTRAVLRHVLRKLDLTWIFWEDVLLITTPEVAEKDLLTRIYDVHDLVTFINEFGEEDCDFDSLIYLITRTIAPTSWDGLLSWDDVGGSGSISEFRATGLDTLVISQTESIHLEVEHLLAALHRMRSDEEAASENSTTVTSAAGEEARAKIETALDEPISVEFMETSLADVCDHLSRACDIPILIDDEALRNVGLDSEVPVTRNLTDLSTRAVLRLILRELDLTWMIQDEVLLITTPEYTEDHLTTKIYDVYDLVAYVDEEVAFDPRMDLDFDTLTDLIVTTVEPMSWDEGTGPSPIEGYQAAGLAVLIIPQTNSIHREIEQLLIALRRMRDDEETTSESSVIAISAAEAETREKIETALDEPISVDFMETSLGDVCTHIEEACNIQIEIDSQALREVGLDTDVPITRSLSNISTRAVLRLLLRELDLIWIVRDECLIITTLNQADDDLVTKVYNVHDLVAYFGDNGDELHDFDLFMDVIFRTIQPLSWNEIGGPGSKMWYPGGVLVVSQVEPIHADIEHLLTTMRRVRDDEEVLSKPSWVATRAAGEEARAKIETAIEETISVEFMGKGLGDVLSQIEDACGIPIEIDSQALRDVGLNADAQVTIALSNVSARAVLIHILREFDLTWVIRDEVLLITTPESCPVYMTKIYNVHDIVYHYDYFREEGHEQDPQIYIDGNVFYDLITSVVDPNSWEDIGGAGSCSNFQAIGLNVLLISQTEDNHRQVEHLLTTLRRARNEEAAHTTPEPAQPVIAWNQSEAQRKIEAALDEPISVDFTERELSDVSVVISGVSGIPILLDAQALSDVGLDPEVLITFTATNMPAREVLREILKELDLTWIIRHEVLVITTRESCPAHLTTFYCVQDLVTFAEEDGDEIADFDRLIELIYLTNDPESWDIKKGGEGSIDEYQLLGLSILVISQTESIHRDVELFLTTLRSARNEEAFENGPRLVPLQSYWLSDPWGGSSPVGPSGFRPANDPEEE